MAKSKKSKRKQVRQVARVQSNRDTMVRTEKLKQKHQSLWLRIGIGLASVAMIGFTVSQFLPTPGSAVPVLKTSAFTPSSQISDVTLVPVPAEQVGNYGGQTVPTVNTPSVVTSTIQADEVQLVPIPADQVGKSGAQTIPSRTTPTIKTTSAPTQIVGMDRTSYVQGIQALADINKLHGTDITLSDGYNAVYSWQNLKLTVSVGMVGSSDNAATLVKQMKDTITAGGSQFTNVQPAAADGQNVFQVQGPGGSNYFYQSASNVVWLTIQTPDGTKVDSLLQAALKTF